MYTSSSFYSSTFHPSMEEQVELARQISHSLSADTNSTSKGQSMYVKRRNRSSKWIHEGIFPYTHPSLFARLLFLLIPSISRREKRRIYSPIFHRISTRERSSIDGLVRLGCNPGNKYFSGISIVVVPSRTLEKNTSQCCWAWPSTLEERGGTKNSHSSG